jgi:type VI secretion system secreted protein VgrG
VLKDAGFTPGEDYRFELQQSYPVVEYCVMYRESELNFISRLMQEAGISFFFEHKATNHVLVMCDGDSAYQPIAGAETVIFHRPTGAVTSEEHIFQYHHAQVVRRGDLSRLQLQETGAQSADAVSNGSRRGYLPGGL